MYKNYTGSIAILFIFLPILSPYKNKRRDTIFCEHWPKGRNAERKTAQKAVLKAAMRFYFKINSKVLLKVEKSLRSDLWKRSIKTLFWDVKGQNYA